ncbi:MAG: hypothetical protein J7502_19320 [Flavisolibacter sp.]|nr:hypothetical protein [Flavisolibacter sp.]
MTPTEVKKILDKLQSIEAMAQVIKDEAAKLRKELGCVHTPEIIETPYMSDGLTRKQLDIIIAKRQRFIYKKIAAAQANGGKTK